MKIMKKCCGVVGDTEKASDLFRGDTCHAFTALDLWPFLMKF
jgi:hypothetical protein